jgi:drug/metabolite transporter (DMT)-like permease
MLKGNLFLLASSLFFALSTVFAKFLLEDSVIPAAEITFFRFSTGFIFAAAYVIFTGKSIIPSKFKFIIMRSFTNTIAVLLFFIGIQYTTVSKSNLLNMTYPVFVFLLSPLFNKEKITLQHYIFLLLTMAGSYLVVIPDSAGFDLNSINKGDIFSLLSGVVAGFAINSLREARKTDPSYLVLFYLMGVGTVINIFLIIPGFVIPENKHLINLALTTAASLLGQVFLTVGYKYVSAAEGSIISLSRILFALILGIILFSDPINIRIAAGSIIILVSLLGVSGFMNKKKEPVL